MNVRTLSVFASPLAPCMLSQSLHAEPPSGGPVPAAEAQSDRWIEVSGVGTHLFTTAVIHATSPTPNGFIQRSTDIVELEGDLVGRVLYHVTSEFDFAAGRLVNKGDQVFSGTVLGSAPVMLHDAEFRVEVDLAGQSTSGRMFLVDHLAGPKIRCELEIFGEGETTRAGDAVVDYVGRCRVRGPVTAGPIEP